MALAGREKSMGFIWFLLASIIIGVLLWVAYDDIIGRRTWKVYAQQWEELETKRLEKQIAEEMKAIDPKELKKIRQEKEKVEAKLRGSEYQKLQDEVKAAQIAFDDVKFKYQVAKGTHDELFYRWKHALQEKETEKATEYEKKYNDLEPKVEELKKTQDENETTLIAAQAKKSKFESQLKELEEKENKLLEKVIPLQRQLEAVKDRGSPIEQVVVDELGKAGPIHWGEVDRCQSCHIGTKVPGYEEAKNPFKTHPYLVKNDDSGIAIFDKHPIEEYGCVTCHGGQGRATQTKENSFEEGDYAHGFEKHWPDPLLRGVAGKDNLHYVQSSCNKCHIQQFDVDLAPVYSLGKRTFLEYGCINCHSIKGMDWAPKVGPNLNKIKDKINPEWFHAWLKNTKGYLPNTKMPQPNWYDENDIIKAMAYIWDKSEGFNWKYGEFTGGDASRGQEIFAKVGCMACHNVGGKGGSSGPALDKIGEKTTAKWIYNWIKEPKNWSDHARMPSLRLSDEEARDITAYVSAMGKAKSPDEKLRQALLKKENIEEGFKVINTYGCYACHNIKGFENSSKPSVALTDYGRKDPHELAFGDTKESEVPHTWEGWTNNKLKNPKIYNDERSKSFMPTPNISEEQRHALLVFLRGQKPEDLPEKYIAFDQTKEKGRRLAWWYNCRACHLIEGRGGDDVASIIKEENYRPPNLTSTGARLQTEWMYSFLKNPASHDKIRTWLEIRMPTFGLTDEEADNLVAYFKKVDGIEDYLESTPKHEITAAQMEAAKTLIYQKHQCVSCHIIGNDYPKAGPLVWAPNLAYGDNRLRPEWMNEWIRNAGEVIPGIRMPSYYPDAQSGLPDIFDGNVDMQVESLVNYILYLGHGSKIVSEKSAQEDSGVDEQINSEAANVSGNQQVDAPANAQEVNTESESAAQP